MKRKRILYIGEGPAYLGGITRKSALLVGRLSQYHNVKKVDINVKNNKVISFSIALLKMLYLAGRYDGIIYCLDNERMYLMLKFQKIFHKNSIKKTVVVYSGGSFNELIDEKYNDVIKIIMNARQLWVEIKGINSTLVKRGYHNVVYYPNPRIIEVEKEPIPFNPQNPIRLLYYSQISREKGILNVIEVVKILNEKYKISFSIDFYGLVKEDIKEDFNNFIQNTGNASYKGFNNAPDLDKYYGVLNSYDIMLFPTYWIGEGIAGACVEAKISGVAIIASRHNYNAEIVDVNNCEGMIIDKGDNECIAKQIFKLYSNPSMLNNMKKMSYESRKRFSVDEYEELYKKCFD